MEDFTHFNPICRGWGVKMAPFRVFAKCLNDLANFHQTLWLLRQLGTNHYFSNGGYHFSKAWTQFFLNFSLSKQFFSEILVRQTIYFFNLLKSNNFFSSMGYSRIYGIKGNLSNSTLYRCKGKLLVDADYAALSKAVLYTIICTRGSISPDKVSLPAGKQPNLLFFKGLRKTAKCLMKLGTPASRP